MSKSISRKKRRIRRLLILLSVLSLAYMHVIKNVNPILKEVSQEEVRALTSLAVNTAAQEVMAKNAAYGELVRIEKDSQENISLIETNTPLINDIARQTVSASQQKINEIGERGVKVPLGSLSGITFLSGIGPDLSIKVTPVGAVKMSYRSVFENAGINQTWHKIVMDVICEVSVVMPGSLEAVEVNTEVLLVESLIIGKVPQIYFDNSFSQKLDLIP